MSLGYTEHGKFEVLETDADGHRSSGRFSDCPEKLWIMEMLEREWLRSDKSAAQSLVSALEDAELASHLFPWGLQVRCDPNPIHPWIAWEQVSPISLGSISFIEPSLSSLLALLEKIASALDAWPALPASRLSLDGGQIQIRLKDPSIDIASLGAFNSTSEWGEFSVHLLPVSLPAIFPDQLMPDNTAARRKFLEFPLVARFAALIESLLARGKHHPEGCPRVKQPLRHRLLENRQSQILFQAIWESPHPSPSPTPCRDLLAALGLPLSSLTTGSSGFTPADKTTVEELRARRAAERERRRAIEAKVREIQAMEAETAAAISKFRQAGSWGHRFSQEMGRIMQTIAEACQQISSMGPNVGAFLQTCHALQNEAAEFAGRGREALASLDLHLADIDGLASQLSSFKEEASKATPEQMEMLWEKMRSLGTRVSSLGRESSQSRQVAEESVENLTATLTAVHSQLAAARTAHQEYERTQAVASDLEAKKLKITGLLDDIRPIVSEAANALAGRYQSLKEETTRWPEPGFAPTMGKVEKLMRTGTALIESASSLMAESEKILDADTNHASEIESFLIQLSELNSSLRQNQSSLARQLDQLAGELKAANEQAIANAAADAARIARQRLEEEFRQAFGDLDLDFQKWSDEAQNLSASSQSDIEFTNRKSALLARANDLQNQSQTLQRQWHNQLPGFDFQPLDELSRNLQRVRAHLETSTAKPVPAGIPSFPAPPPVTHIPEPAREPTTKTGPTRIPAGPKEPRTPPSTKVPEKSRSKPLLIAAATIALIGAPLAWYTLREKPSNGEKAPDNGGSQGGGEIGGGGGGTSGENENNPGGSSPPPDVPGILLTAPSMAPVRIDLAQSDWKAKINRTLANSFRWDTDKPDAPSLAFQHRSSRDERWEDGTPEIPGQYEVRARAIWNGQEKSSSSTLALHLERATPPPPPPPPPPVQLSFANAVRDFTFAPEDPPPYPKPSGVPQGATPELRFFNSGGIELSGPPKNAGNYRIKATLSSGSSETEYRILPLRLTLPPKPDRRSEFTAGTPAPAPSDGFQIPGNAPNLNSRLRDQNGNEMQALAQPGDYTLEITLSDPNYVLANPAIWAFKVLPSAPEPVPVPAPASWGRFIAKGGNINHWGDPANFRNLPQAFYLEWIQDPDLLESLRAGFPKACGHSLQMSAYLRPLGQRPVLDFVAVLSEGLDKIAQNPAHAGPALDSLQQSATSASNVLRGPHPQAATQLAAAANKLKPIPPPPPPQ